MQAKKRVKSPDKLKKDLHFSMFEALDRVYAQPITENTPVDTGITSRAWELLPNGFLEFTLRNFNGQVVGYLEYGTGIYGARRRYIRPVQAKALRWYSRKKKRYVFAKKVKGIKPHKFIEAVVIDKGNERNFYEAFRQSLKRKR